MCSPDVEPQYPTYVSVHRQLSKFAHVFSRFFSSLRYLKLESLALEQLVSTSNAFRVVQKH